MEEICPICLEVRYFDSETGLADVIGMIFFSFLIHFLISFVPPIFKAV